MCQHEQQKSMFYWMETLSGIVLCENLTGKYVV